MTVHDTPMVPVGAEIREVALPLRRPYRTAGTDITERRILLIRLFAEGLDGWGECGPVPGYSPETLADCRSSLETTLGLLVGRGAAEAATRLPDAAGFALESALADLAARRAGNPLWRHLGGSRSVIPVGVVIGLDIPVSELGTAAEWFLDMGYRRIKLKIAPGEDVRRAAAVRAVLPSSNVAVDANGSYPPEGVTAPAALDAYELSFIEQPFPAAALDATARLASAVATPICLDESIGSVAEAEAAIDRGAAGIINVKPARVGGLSAAREIHDVARRRGVPLWCGGMLESGIGKAAALAVASLPGMVMAADLPPSRRHFATDLVTPEWTMAEDGIHLPENPGLGVEIDAEVIDRTTTSIVRIGDCP